MIDPDLVGRKALLIITRDLGDLAPFARKPLYEYLASPLDELVAERLLERIVGRMIDINYHVLTETGARAAHCRPRWPSKPNRSRVRRDRAAQGARGARHGHARRRRGPLGDRGLREATPSE